METPERIFPTESIDGDRHVARHNQYEFDVYKLIHLSREIPETSITLEDYVGQLDGACWTDGDEHRITPRSVLEIY